MAQLQIGTAQVDITPPVGSRMAGYGGRTEGAQGIHDPLYARAMVLDDGTTEAAIVACDLVGLDKHAVTLIRETAQALTGIPPEQVMVCTTHTHAGPAIRISRGSPDVARGQPPIEALVEITARQIAGAVAMAHRSRREGVLKVGTGTVSSVGQNRRHPDWPVDPNLKVLRADTPERELIGAILNYPCHGTVMNRDNLMISADYPGAAVRTVQKVVGADVPVLFINGAFANINPVWTEQVFAEVERNGMILGGEAIRVLAEIQAAGQRVQVHNIRLREWPEHRVQGELIADARLNVASTTVQLPFRELLSQEAYSQEIENLAQELMATVGAEEQQISRASWQEGLQDYLERVVALDKDTLSDRRRLNAALTKLSSSRSTLSRMAVLSEDSPEGVTTEIQAIAVSPRLAFVSVPGELFVEIGQAIERQSNVEHMFLCGNSNDSVGYLITAEAHEQGGYEAGTTLFAPQAEDIVREAAVRLLSEVTA